MNVFKLQPGLRPVHKISRDKFEAMTGKMAPWYQREGDKIAPFAVCPACDNPIRIVALYERHENSPSPYGKHSPKTVAGLATYNQIAYDDCPYAHPGMELDRDRRRPETDPRGRDILQLLRDQFDRVIYIIQRDTGIIISPALAKSLLESFLGMQGHLYVGTNLCNLPWMFAYMTTGQTLFGRKIKQGCELMLALEGNKDISITEESKVTSSKKEFLEITFCFIEHKIIQKGSSQEETIKFLVNMKEKEIFHQTIKIDPVYFHNLVNLPPERASRDERLLDIAAMNITL